MTIGVSCTPESELSRRVRIAITPLPGPEAIAGSTRLKAGTATKLVLNMLTTGAFIRRGYVWGKSDGQRAAEEFETAGPRDAEL